MSSAPSSDDAGERRIVSFRPRLFRQFGCLYLATRAARTEDPTSQPFQTECFLDDVRFFRVTEVRDLRESSGFQELAWVQTLFHDVASLQTAAPVRPEYGQGLFVAVRSTRTLPTATGRQSALIKMGHNRDGKRGVPQIVYGLVCAPDGCPIAIEVFSGNTADPTTFTAQVNKIRHRFGIQRVVLVGDRGMITSKRIDEELREAEGLEWITALRNHSIRKLVEQKTIQLSLFDQRDLAEVTSSDYPDERLIVCRDPLLAEERATDDVRNRLRKKPHWIQLAGLKGV